MYTQSVCCRGLYELLDPFDRFIRRIRYHSDRDISRDSARLADFLCFPEISRKLEKGVRHMLFVFRFEEPETRRLSLLSRWKMITNLRARPKCAGRVFFKADICTSRRRKATQCFVERSYLCTMYNLSAASCDCRQISIPATHR